MSRLLFRLFVNAAALWVAAYFVNGITLSEDFVSVLGVALIFGLVNAIIKPIVSLLALPFILLTLGLLTLVINAGMLLITDRFSDALSVSGFVPALIGALVISVVSVLLGGKHKNTKD